MSHFTKKPISMLRAQAAEEGAHTLRRGLGSLELTTLGVGAVIGAGIFVLTGHAAHDLAGPAIVISFVIAGGVCLFAALCYAELASMIPVSGSAYTYAFATLGQLFAWIIAWDLMVEYLFAAGTVAVGWSGYFTGLMSDLGVEIPKIWSAAPFAGETWGALHATGAILNLPAMAIIALTAFVLILGVTESAAFNTVVVLIKLGVVVLVIAFGFFHVDPANWTPFIPDEVAGDAGTTKFGVPGIVHAAGVIFFAYIGFEVISTAAQEARNPERTMPVSILGALVVCTVLYVLMCLVITGVVKYADPGLGLPRPIYTVVQAMGPGLEWLKFTVTIGATIGLASTILALLYGQSRIFYAMGRDGLLPPIFCAVHSRRRTPWFGTLITALFAGLMAGLFPVGLLGELVSVGTLLAFAMICAGVIYLRVKEPQLPRAFRVPVFWLVAPLGIASCLYLIAGLPSDTFVRLVVWMAIGLAVYFGYAQFHSRMRASQGAAAE